LQKKQKTEEYIGGRTGEFKLKEEVRDTEFDRNQAFRLSVLYLIFALLPFFLCLLGERELRIVDISRYMYYYNGIKS